MTLYQIIAQMIFRRTNLKILEYILDSSIDFHFMDTRDQLKPKLGCVLQDVYAFESKFEDTILSKYIDILKMTFMFAIRKNNLSIEYFLIMN